VLSLLSSQEGGATFGFTHTYKNSAPMTTKKNIRKQIASIEEPRRKRKTFEFIAQLDSLLNTCAKHKRRNEGREVVEVSVKAWDADLSSRTMSPHRLRIPLSTKDSLSERQPLPAVIYQ
jgi:hypothetical protein